MNKTTKLAVSAALGTVLFAVGPMRAYAQEDVNSKIVSSLEYQQADVREALQALFKDVDVSYSIDPSVQGQVTLSLHKVSFSTALQNILRQVDATYRIEVGVYQIIKREEVITPKDPVDQGVIGPHEVLRRIKINSADPELIALLLGAKSGNQTWTLAPEISSLQKGGQNGGMRGGSGGGIGTGGSGFGQGSTGFGQGSTGFGSGSGSGSGSGPSGRG